MGDIIIKVDRRGVNDPREFCDGDVVVTFTDYDIGRRWIDSICHPAKCLFNRDGLREDECSESVYRTLKTWHFRRVSRTEFTKYNQFSGRLEIHRLPWLQAWIDWMTSHPRHRFYGKAGFERWYHNPWCPDDDGLLNRAWDYVEEHKGLKRSDFPHVDAGRLGPRLNVVVSMEFDKTDQLFWSGQHIDDDGDIVVQRCFKMDWRKWFPEKTMDIMDPERVADFRHTPLPRDAIENKGWQVTL